MKHLTAACLLALAPAVAMANIIPTGTSITGAGPYTWTYDFLLSIDQNVNPGPAPLANPVPHLNLDVGGFLTIYDFTGYIAGTCTGPAGWTCTVQNVGYTPDDTIPTDNPNLPNITWTHTSGPVLLGQPNGQNLGQFTAQSIYGTPTLVDYSARGVKNNGFSVGTIADNVGNTQGPLATAIPEPGSMALAGLGLVCLGLSINRKRKA